MLTTFAYTPQGHSADHKQWTVHYGFPFVESLIDATLAVVSRQCARFLDVARSTDQDISCFVDPVHLGDKGNGVLAKARRSREEVGTAGEAGRAPGRSTPWTAAERGGARFGSQPLARGAKAIGRSEGTGPRGLWLDPERGTVRRKRAAAV